MKMKTQRDQQEEQARRAAQAADIIGMLADCSSGHFAAECGRKLSELVAAISETRTKGKLTIIFEVEPGSVGDDGQVRQLDVRPEVKITKPERPMGKSIFFRTDDNKVTRKHPDQMEMELENAE